MAKCKFCGRPVLFSGVDDMGYCRRCAVARIEREQRQAEAERVERQKEADEWAKIEKIPAYSITLMDTPRKRRRGFDGVDFSNITPKGVYNDIVVFDTETTGLAPSKDRIVELAAIKYADARPVLKFQSYVNPGRPIPPEARKINGITDEMVADAPAIGQILQSFEDFVGSSTLVAHNLNFDLRFLFYSGSVITDTKRRYIDTLEQAQRMLKKPKRGGDSDNYDVEDHKLDTLCYYYRIPRPKRHSALADAFATGTLFFNLVDEKRP